MSLSKRNKFSSQPKTGYSEAFKRQVVTEFEQGLSSKAQLRRKYGISGHVTLDDWLRKYGKLHHQTYSTIGRPMKDKDKQYLKELELRIKERELALEKQLLEKEQELAAYKKFIEIAERELNICIVKKSGTKQSKK